MPGNPIDPADAYYHYSGRIDFRDPSAPKFSYAGSYISTCFQGTSLRAVFDDLGDRWNVSGNKVGFILDNGTMIVNVLEKGQPGQDVMVAADLKDTIHSLVIAKLVGPGQGSSTLVFKGLALDDGKMLEAPAPRPITKIEVYGDSVTEGESAGCLEGTHDCGDGSGWLSYANILARMLNAEIHNLGIGGLAVRNETGYYDGAHTGLEKTWDKVKPYNDMPAWDFSRFTPNLIIMAMGVNDASTGALDDLPAWKESYLSIVRAISQKYGSAVPILFTVAAIETAADKAYPCVQQVADTLCAEGLQTEVCRFSFRVSGHPNRVEHQAMAEELYRFITEKGMIK